MFAESITPYLADFGESVTVDGVVTRGIFDTASEVALGEAIVVAPSLLLASTVAADAGDAVVIRSANYKIRQVLDEPPDGVMRRLVLAKV